MYTQDNRHDRVRNKDGDQPSEASSASITGSFDTSRTHSEIGGRPPATTDAMRAAFRANELVMGGHRSTSEQPLNGNSEGDRQQQSEPFQRPAGIANPFISTLASQTGRAYDPRIHTIRDFLPQGQPHSQSLGSSRIPLQSPETHQEAIPQSRSTPNSNDGSLRAQSPKYHMHGTHPYKAIRPTQTSDRGSEASSTKSLTRRLEAIALDSLLEPKTRETLKQRIKISKTFLNNIRTHISDSNVRAKMIQTIALIERDTSQLSHDTSLRINQHNQKIESLDQEIRSPEIIMQLSKEKIEQLNRQKRATNSSTLLNQESKVKYIQDINNQISSEEIIIEEKKVTISSIEKKMQNELKQLNQARNDQAELDVSNIEIQDLRKQLEKSSFPPQTSEGIPQESSNRPDTFSSHDTGETHEVSQHPIPTDRFGNQTIADIFPNIDLNYIDDPVERNAHKEVMYRYAQELCNKSIESLQSDPACQNILDHYNTKPIHYKWYGTKKKLTRLKAFYSIRDDTILVGPGISSIQSLGVRIDDETKHLYKHINMQEVNKHLQDGRSITWATDTIRILRPYYKQTETFEGKTGPVGLYFTDNYTQLTQNFGGSNTWITQLYNTSKNINFVGPWTRPDGAVRVQPLAHRIHIQKYGTAEKWN